MSPGESAVGAAGNRRLAVLLAMAMFVLVVDTSLMNVSIASVVEDLDTTVSGVQGAIALEALVSAAFILIGSKIGDLIGRKRAFVLGLLGYAMGALAMAFAQGLTAIIVFWAIIGGLGASLLLPAMQSLIHGNFQGAAQKKAYALVGAAAAIAAAVGPLLGGFLTTFLSWRVGFLLEVVVIAVVLINLKLIKDVPYTGPRVVDVVGALLSAVGMGGVVIGILVWQEGGEFVGVLIAVGLVALGSLARWLVRRKREGKPTLLDPDLFKHDLFRLGISSQMLQNIALGGAMIALPIYLQMVLEYNALETGLTIAPLSLTMFATALVAGKRAGRRRPASIIRVGSGLLTVGMLLLIPIVPRADSGWALVIPLIIAGCRTGPAGVPAQQLHPLADLRRARQRGGRRQLRRRVLRAVVRARVRRGHHARDALDRVHPDGGGQHRAAGRLPGAGRPGARRGRGGDEQHAARGAARRRAAGDPGRDHPDQHRRATARPAGRAARPDPRRPARAAQRVPDDAPTRPVPSDAAEIALA